MIPQDEQSRIRELLTEAITVLCKNSIKYRSEVSIEGLLGITVDQEEIILVGIHQAFVGTNNEVSSAAQTSSSSMLQQKRRRGRPRKNFMTGLDPSVMGNIELSADSSTFTVTDEYHDEDMQDEEQKKKPRLSTDVDFVGVDSIEKDDREFPVKQEASDEDYLHENGNPSRDSFIEDHHTMNMEQDQRNRQFVTGSVFKSQSSSVPIDTPPSTTGYRSHAESTLQALRDSLIEDQELVSQDSMKHESPQKSDLSREQSMQAPNTPIPSTVGQTASTPGQVLFEQPNMMTPSRPPPRSANTMPVAKLNAQQLSDTMCQVCGRGFMSKSGLAHHMKHHTGNYNYFCKECQKGFLNRKRYIEHMAKHKGQSFDCQFCGKKYESMTGLSLHVTIHTGDYRYPCPHCQKGFNRKEQYEKHLIMHLLKEPPVGSSSAQYYTEAGGSRSKSSQADEDLLSGLAAYQAQQSDYSSTAMKLQKSTHPMHAVPNDHSKVMEDQSQAPKDHNVIDSKFYPTVMEDNQRI